MLGLLERKGFGIFGISELEQLGPIWRVVCWVVQLLFEFRVNVSQ